MEFVFLFWTTFTQYESIHVAADGIISLFLWLSNIYIYMLIPHLLYSFIRQWTFGLFPCLGCCEQCCNEHRGACILFNESFVQRYLRKLNVVLLSDLAIPLLGIYSEKTISRKDTCTPMSTAALFTTAKTWKQPKCLWTEDWIKKMQCICTQWNSTQPQKRMK